MFKFSKLLAAVGLLAVGVFFATSTSQARHSPTPRLTIPDSEGNPADGKAGNPQLVWKQGTVIAGRFAKHTTYWWCDDQDCVDEVSRNETRLEGLHGTPERIVAWDNCEWAWRERQPERVNHYDKQWVLPGGNCGHHYRTNGYINHADAPLPRLICFNGTWQDGDWLDPTIPSRPYGLSPNRRVLTPPTYPVLTTGGRQKIPTLPDAVAHNAIGTSDRPAVPGHACGEWVPAETTTTTTTTTTSSTTSTTTTTLPPDGSCNHPANRDFDGKDYFVSILNTSVEGYEGDHRSTVVRLWRRTPQTSPTGTIRLEYAWLARNINSTLSATNGLSPTAEARVSPYLSPSPRADVGRGGGRYPVVPQSVSNITLRANTLWLDNNGEVDEDGCLYNSQFRYGLSFINNSAGDDGSDETFHLLFHSSSDNVALGNRLATFTIKDGAPPTTTTTTPPAPPHTTTTTTPQTITTVPPIVCPTHDYYVAAGITPDQQLRADDWQGPRPQRSEGCDSGEYEFEIPPITAVSSPSIVGFGNTCVDYRAVSDGYIVANLGGLPSTLPIVSNDYVALVSGSTTQRVAVDLTIDRQPSEGFARLVGNRVEYTPHAWASGQDELVYSIQERGNSVGCRSVARVQLTFAAKPPTAAGYGIVRIPYTNNDQAETGETKGLRAAYYRPDGVKDPHTYELRHEAVAHFDVWDKTT